MKDIDSTNQTYDPFLRAFCAQPLVFHYMQAKLLHSAGLVLVGPRHGDPHDLSDYKGGRDYEALRAFVEEMSDRGVINISRILLQLTSNGSNLLAMAPTY